jgi:pimeloyl-ACP methyl ester carboxylesterase
MSAVIIDGSIVHYESLGRGKPVVFIHGWLGSWRYWMPTMGELSDLYRTYALDLWGFGDTDKSRPRYTLSNYTEQLGAFLDELGIRRAPLIGHALGAAVALRMATAFPDRVERLAVISLPLAAQEVNAKALATGKGAFGGPFSKQSAEYGPVLSEIDKADRQAVEVSVASLDDLDLRAELGTLQMPTLLVYGGKDSFVNPPNEELWPGEQPLPATLRAMFMSQARHFPMLEDANRFNRLLRDFLTLDLSVPENLQTLEFKEEWRRRMR